MGWYRFGIELGKKLITDINDILLVIQLNRG